MDKSTNQIDKKKALQMFRSKLMKLEFPKEDITLFIRYAKDLGVIDILELLRYTEEQLDEELSIYKNELDELRRCKRECI